MPNDSPGIQVLCPTRWTVRTQALHSILGNSEVLQILWDELLEILKDTKMRSRIQGVSSCMKSFDYFLEYHWESYYLTTVITLVKPFSHLVCQQQKVR